MLVYRLAGAQLGDGSGRLAATAAGALLGALLGDAIATDQASACSAPRYGDAR